MGQPEKGFWTPATQRGKTGTSKHRRCRGLCRPSVPKGIKQACQAEYKGGKINSKIKKGFQKFCSFKTNIFFFSPQGVKYQVSSKLQQEVDFKPRFKFPSHFFLRPNQQFSRRNSTDFRFKSKAYKSNLAQNEGNQSSNEHRQCKSIEQRYKNLIR